MENTTLEKEMSKSKTKLLEYFHEFEQGKKPLGQKGQTVCRAFLHKVYAPYVSWITNKGFEWKAEETPVKEISKSIIESTDKFGPKTFEAAQQKIEVLQKNLIQKGKYELADRIPNTMLFCAEKVLNTDLITAIKFLCNEKKNKIAETLTA